jgi:hypothetical protein
MCDLISGELIDELPLDVSSFSRIINGAGTLSATLALGDLGDLDWQAATMPRRTAVYVLRDDTTIVWAGWIRKRRPLDGGTRAGIDCETLESYYASRRVKHSVPIVDLGFVDDDAFDIVRAMLGILAAEPNGNIRTSFDLGLSGQTHTISYFRNERRKVLEEWVKLATIEPGFEFTIDAGYNSSGLITNTLRLAAPRFADGVEPIVCEYPGNVWEYDWPEDESNVPTRLTGIGAGEGSSMLTSEVTDLAALAAGYPLLEDEVMLKEETSQARLDARTAEKLRALTGDAVVPTVVLRGDAEPGFGSYPLGIQARLRVTSLYHPAQADGSPGIDTLRRVVGWTVQPAQAGRQDRVTLALGRVDADG